METTRLWLDCFRDILIMFVIALMVLCAYVAGYEARKKEERKYDTPQKVVRRAPRKLHY